MRPRARSCGALQLDPYYRHPKARGRYVQGVDVAPNGDRCVTTLWIDGKQIGNIVDISFERETPPIDIPKDFPGYTGTAEGTFTFEAPCDSN